MNMGVFLAISPLLVVSTGGVLLMVAEAFSRRREETDGRVVGPSSELALGTAVTLLAGAVFSLALCVVGPDKVEGVKAVEPYLLVDRFSLFFSFVLCLGGALASLLAGGYLPEHKIDRGEFYPLLTFSTVGCMILASAGDMLSLFLGLETMSLGVYALTGFRRGSARSAEAAVKYFLLGSFAAALLLYGIALIYGTTGHTDLAGIRAAITAAPAAGAAAPNLAVVLVATALILAGLAFKVGAVPFHMWTPDVYEGAPTPVTAFFASAPKMAAMALMVRVFVGAFPGILAQWQQIIVFIAIISMTLGAFAAIGQRNFKRLMAYSSIGHMGFALIGLAAGTAEGIQGVLVYMAIYLAMTLGTFAVILSMRRPEGQVEEIADLAGLSRTNPGMAFFLAMLLFSLAGIPPLAGFFAKFYVFLAAIQAGLYTLAVIGVLASVVGAYYYLLIVKIMYFDEPAEAFVPMSGTLKAVLGISGLFNIFFFAFPAPLVAAAAAAAKSLF